MQLNPGIWIAAQVVLDLIKHSGDRGLWIRAKDFHQASSPCRPLQTTQHRISQPGCTKLVVVIKPCIAVLEIQGTRLRHPASHRRAGKGRHRVLFRIELHMHAGGKIAVHLAQANLDVRHATAGECLIQIDPGQHIVTPFFKRCLTDTERIVRLAHNISLEITNPRAISVLRVSGIALIFVNDLGHLDGFSRNARHVGIRRGHLVQRTAGFPGHRLGDKQLPQASALHVGNDAAHPRTQELVLLRLSRCPSTTATHFRPGNQCLEALDLHALKLALNKRQRLHPGSQVQCRVALLNHRSHLDVVGQLISRLHGLRLQGSRIALSHRRIADLPQP